ncbi:hypothetical protein FH972_006154 [Carpinus fangiana]|uniref:Uncharacterized protein n=1 Tax=Carpinus fangiana TaxID=176857 RepID=A0A5N6QUC5_9ROSI|nr:hypothetical protein FH972_006154 [Carpinus fangiana]
MVFRQCEGHMEIYTIPFKSTKAILVQAMASSFGSWLEEIVKKAGQDPCRCLLQSLVLVGSSLSHSILLFLCV